MTEVHAAHHSAGGGDTKLAPRGGVSHVVGDTGRAAVGTDHPALLADTVARYGPREAAVFVAQDKRFTWNELAAAVDDLAAGFLALGLEKGDRIGIWSPNRWEWLVTQFATARIGLILVNINPAYRLSELDYALNKVGCKALVTAASFKTSDYLAMLATLAPELATAEPGKLEAARLPHLRIVIRMGEEPSRGHAELRRRARRGRPGGARAARRDLGVARPRRRHQHPVHPRHHRRAEGRDAHAPQHRQQWQPGHRGDELRPGRPALHPGAALPLLRHVDGHARLRHARARRWSFRARASTRGATLGAVAAERCTGAVRRADHVRRDARPSRLRALRPVEPAHRHHGRRALPDRGDEAGHRADAHARGDHRLRHDRDQPGVVPEPRRRSAGEARLHRRPHPSACRGQDRRRRRARSCRSASRASCARAAIR